MSNGQPTVLIIDNDEGLVAALQTRLEHAGYDCTPAASGAQGIEAFRSRPIQLVITDLNMPEGDGVRLARTLREVSNVPIIVITGYHEEYRRELRSIPNVTVVQKPFESSALLDLVDAELVLAGCEIP